MLQPRKSVQNTNGYAVPLYGTIWDIKIDGNENNYGPSPLVTQALHNVTLKDICFYPFYGELTEEISEFYVFDTEEIKVTNGADEALQSIICTYLEVGETLLTLDVSFDMPVVYAQLQGGNVKKVPYCKKWEFPANEFLNELKDKSVKVVYIATPNNPTGNIISENDILKIIQNATDKVIIIDETYANYANISYKNLAKKYDNVFVVRSFSKDFALAGLRLGCVLSNKNNIENLKKVISPYSVNSIAMKAGIAALNDVKYFEKIREEVNFSKTELKEFFESLSATVYNSYANFLLVDFGEKAEFVYEKLKKAKIAVKLYKKGNVIENHLRITVPTKAGVKKIKEVLTPKPYLVFDMDGVIVNAGNSYRLAIKKTYEHFSGKTVSAEEIQKVKNSGGLNNDWDLTDFLLRRDNITIEYKKIVDVFQNFYWQNGDGFINNEECLFDKDVLNRLVEKYNLAIFTGRLRLEADFALNKFGIKDYFYPVITTDDIPQGKCKPDPYGLKLIKSLTIANDYYYFGDTTDDILAARGANYTVTGVLPPQDKSEELIASLKNKGAKFVIKSVNNIEEILENKLCDNLQK